MAPFFRIVTRRILIVINIIFAALFLLACLNVYLNPVQWWFIALLGLAFPFLLVFVFLFLLFWIAFRSKWVLLSLAALVIGYSNIRALVGLHFSQPDFETGHSKGSVRILTWNVLGFEGIRHQTEKIQDNRKNMMKFILSRDADILCFQEFLEPNNPAKYSNVRAIRSMGYPYYYFVADYGRGGGVYASGIAIFSKYPIIDSSRIRFPGPKEVNAAESLISADLNVNGDTIRIFTTHLQSIRLKKNDYRNVEIIKNAEDSMVQASRSLVRKLRMGYLFRGTQANIVRKQMDESPYPSIICGDFNDIPNSYVYFRIRGSHKDAFVEKGLGLDRTFVNLSPTLRIDYIMPDKTFRVLQYHRQVLPYSDHFPLIADILLKEQQNTVKHE